MVRCAWCGASNYAIDMWCARCKRHLDWQPASRRRPVFLGILAPAAAAVAVAIALAIPVAGGFNGTIRLSLPSLPGTGSGQASSAAVGQSVAASTPTVEPSATAETTAPLTGADPSAAPEPTEAASPPLVLGPAPSPAAQLRPMAPPVVVPQGGDPTTAVSRFYQAVAAHQFGAAASLWSSRMQSQYPPALYIDHRFSATQQIGLASAHVVTNGGGVAVVHVDVSELIGGQHREWVGTWQLIASPSGWLLNSPDLRAA